MVIHGIATADLHLGIDNVGGLNEQGLPARVDDYFEALDFIIARALEREVNLFIIAGDIAKQRNPPQRIVAPLFQRLAYLREKGITVILLRGNHDGDSGDARWNLLDAAGHLNRTHIIPFNDPAHLTVCTERGDVGVTGIPWPRLSRGDSRPLDEAAASHDRAVRETIRGLVDPLSGVDLYGDAPQILVGHLAVAGADRASDEWMTLGYEPLVRPQDFPDTLDLVILGHYHKPGRIEVPGRPGPIFYCGSPVAVDFGEEGQEKNCWYFELDVSQPPGQRCMKLEAIPVPGRSFVTLDFDVLDAAFPEPLPEHFQLAVPTGVDLHDAIVRARVRCATAEQAAAVNINAVAAGLKEAGAWWVQGVTVEAPRAERRWQGGDGLAEQSPQDLLMRYLGEAEPDEARRKRLYELAMTEADHDPNQQD